METTNLECLNKQGLIIKEHTIVLNPIWKKQNKNKFLLWGNAHWALKWQCPTGDLSKS